MRYIIKRILKESEQEFGWVDDVLNHRDISWVPKGDGYQLFYFYPKIDIEEYNQYVVPVLLENGIRISDVTDQELDHLEIHNNKFGGDDRLALAGYVNYHGSTGDDKTVLNGFLKELSVDGAIPHNGRQIFRIPS